MNSWALKSPNFVVIGIRPFIYHFSSRKFWLKNHQKTLLLSHIQELTKMTYWQRLIISRTKRLNFWQKFLHFIFCQKYFLEFELILDGDRLSVCPCFNSRCIMDWNVSSLSHVWTFLNMMNREYLVENFQVLYNWLFRNFQFSNFNFFSSVWIMIEMTLSNSILDGLGMMFFGETSLKTSQTFNLDKFHFRWLKISVIGIGKAA